jgi:hypothetical protein
VGPPPPGGAPPPHGPTQTLTISATLTGDDVSPGAVELPVEVTGSVLFAAVAGGDPLTAVESYVAPFIFGDAEDEATLRHHVEVPEQV